MARTYLPPDAVLHLDPPVEGLDRVPLRALKAGAWPGMPPSGVAALRAAGRYLDPELGVLLTPAEDRRGRFFVDRDWGPFLGLDQHDVGLVVRSLAHGVSPLTVGGRGGPGGVFRAAWGDRDRLLPFLEALIEAGAWPDADVATVLDQVGRDRPLPGVRVNRRTLLDLALAHGRWVLADRLWEHGVRFSPRARAAGEPVWAVWRCPFGQWAVALGEPGCSTPDAASTVWSRMTQAQGQHLMRRTVPLLLRWLDRGLDAGTRLDLVPRMRYADAGNPPNGARTLTTGVVGMVLSHMARNLYPPGMRDALALHQVERLLRAGAEANVPLVWDDGTVCTPVAFARDHGLPGTSARLEQAMLRAEPAEPTATAPVRARRRL